MDRHTGFHTIPNVDTVAIPVPCLTMIVSCCRNCADDITQTASDLPWYHKKSGSEKCYQKEVERFVK